MSKPKHSTREEWLEEAAQLLADEILKPHAGGYKARWQVSCGWPSTRSQSANNRRIGECWHAEACADGRTRHLFISPVLDDPIKVLATLLHELVHAVLPAEVGHRAPFRRLAVACGLTGKMTATTPGTELLQRLNRLAKQLGKYPHAALTGHSARRKQTTRLLKVACKPCGYTVRVTRMWLDVGRPQCPEGHAMKEC